MVAILQHECDAEVKNLLMEFNKNRQIQYRSKQVNESTARSAGGGGSVGSNSIQALGHYRKPSGGSVDKLNPKEIDAIIAEITVMHARVELYFRFMRRRLQVRRNATRRRPGVTHKLFLAGSHRDVCAREGANGNNGAL